MARSDDKLERVKPEITGLESYRRLIELQKQMIELSQHYEQTKRERDVLRDEIVREVADQLRARRSLRHRLQHKSVLLFKRLRFPFGKLANPPQFSNRISTTPSASN
jgi:hypothetical protein